MDHELSARHRSPARIPGHREHLKWLFRGRSPRSQFNTVFPSFQRMTPHTATSVVALGMTPCHHLLLALALALALAGAPAHAEREM